MAIKAKIKGKVLTIEIDINDQPTPSASGKTLVVASSHGNQAIADCEVGGKPLVIGLNAYIAR